MTKRPLAAAACALAVSLLAGCATGYQDAGGLAGIFGGYYEQKGPGELIKVGFSGNAYITSTKARDYLTYRCAEITRREGHAWFAIYRNLPDAIRDARAPEKEPGALGNKPWGEVYILFFDSESPGLLSVEDVTTRLRPVIEDTGAKR